MNIFESDSVFEHTISQIGSTHSQPEVDPHFHIKLMSYNIWNLNPEEDYFTKMRIISKQIKAINPDVIGFQEVRFSNIDYPRIRKGIQVEEIARSLPGYQFVFQAAHSEFPYDLGENPYYTTKEGVAIFSRYPIIHSRYIPLSRNFSDSEDAHQRVCLGVVIKTPGGEISVFSTHFALSAIARKRNVVELYEFMQSFPKPSLLVGDFNTEPDTPEIHFLKGHHSLGGFHSTLRDAFDHVVHREGLEGDEEAQLAAGWTYTTLTREPKKRIDFVFYSPPLEVTSFLLDNAYQAGDVVASDHRPIVATFRIRPSL
uniref:Endonuclease/exonuclease/phosphatase domain-containing protein n=1 Tax=Arcella intermedia TaxID=1963864 RepID=A0A6B2L8B9_9EUKA